ncbi:MAG: DUF4315 family protein [Eubacteriales bacterium]|nr:DUF4315 family protein [Eubacteriales bacterium]
MNPKIQKLTEEIERISVRIAHLQNRLQELTQQREELENTEILGLVRSVQATPEELAAFIKSFRQKGKPALNLNTQEEPENE